MVMCFTAVMNPSTSSLQNTLKQARHARRLSQLELSLRVGVSQRHLSFVESGRAKPSRQLLMAWLQELEAPLALRNAAMLQAGYAPVFGAAPLSDPSMAAAHSAVVQLLKSHDPMPAFVIDAHWNLLRFNQGGQWLAATLMPWITALPATSPLNMLDLLVHPQGFASQLLNLSEVGPVLLSHLRGEASLQPAIAAKVNAFADYLGQHTGVQNPAPHLPRHTFPMLTSRFATDYGELTFFSMFTTFGTPQDITLESLRVEHMFAADAATATVLKREVSALQ